LDQFDGGEVVDTVNEGRDIGYQLPNLFALRMATVLVAVLILLEGRGIAEGLTGYMELQYNKMNTKTEGGGLPATESKSDAFTQRYKLDLDKRIYPNLGMHAGGVFERTDSTVETDVQESDMTTTKINPYANLRLQTPLYLAEGGFDRNEATVKTSLGPPNTNIRDNYFANLGWFPDGFPSAQLLYFHTNTYDKDRLIRDDVSDRYQFTSEYRPVAPLYLKYTGTYGDQNIRLEKTEFRSISHEGKIIYADQWWRNRISLSSDYTIGYRQDEISTSGAGEVRFPLLPFSGLSAITDNPADVVLDLNSALVDGNLVEGTVFNLGLPPPGGEARPRNLGLDFVFETEANTLLVWVDRELPPEIATAFSWDIYTSADNKTWILRQSAAPAVFGPFINAFEIRFASVKARYIKVVTRPLSPGVAFSTNFPTILVTELQAVNRKPVADVEGKTSQTTHRYNLGARAKILGTPSLYYELTYFFIKTGPSPSSSSLSNGLSLQHQFSKIFSGAARVAREDGRDEKGDRFAYAYTASVSAIPLDTLSHTLVFSGRNETVLEEKTDSYSIFLYNTAQLYKGIDLNLGAGISTSKSGTGRKNESDQITGSLSLVPNPALAVTLTHTGTLTKSSEGEGPEESVSTRGSEASVAYYPLKAVYMFASYRIDRTSGQRQATTRNFSANWTPFPDGNLHFSFFYSESSSRAENQFSQRNITPFLRWNIHRGSFLDLSYQILTTDSPVGSTSSNIASGNLHVAF
jgi:hypothetical protein